MKAKINLYKILLRYPMGMIVVKPFATTNTERRTIIREAKEVYSNCIEDNNVIIELWEQ